MLDPDEGQRIDVPMEHAPPEASVPHEVPPKVLHEVPFEEPSVFEDVDPPVTGDAEVDAALAALATAVRGPLEEHLAGYESAYRTLQDRLADVEG